jgi:hypothetical protein
MNVVKQLVLASLRSRGYALLPATGYQFSSRLANQFAYFSTLFARIRDLDGDVVECGMYRGCSFVQLACLVAGEHRNRWLWGFDSFQGFPDLTPEDVGSTPARKGHFSNTSSRHVFDSLRDAYLPAEFIKERVRIVPGFFAETLQTFKRPVAFLHVDCDLYQSHWDCLNRLYPLLVPGGIIAFDEYDSTTETEVYPGAKRAIDEFIASQSLTLQRDPSYGKVFLIKAAACDVKGEGVDRARYEGSDSRR